MSVIRFLRDVILALLAAAVLGVIGWAVASGVEPESLPVAVGALCGIIGAAVYWSTR